MDHDNVDDRHTNDIHHCGNFEAITTSGSGEWNEGNMRWCFVLLRRMPYNTNEVPDTSIEQKRRPRLQVREAVLWSLYHAADLLTSSLQVLHDAEVLRGTFLVLHFRCELHFLGV